MPEMRCEGDEFHPNPSAPTERLKSICDGKSYWLADGFHRLEAASRAGFSEIRTEIYDGTRRDAVLHACSANATHGYRRTNADKRRAVLTLLQDDEWGKWSDNEIARQCKVGNQMVGHLRSSLCESQSQPGERTYTTRHGTQATMSVGNIGQKPAQATETDSAPDETDVDDADAEKTEAEPRPMGGLYAQLTPEQQERALNLDVDPSSGRSDLPGISR